MNHGPVTNDRPFGGDRLPALDGVRAIAAFVVLLYHVAMESGAGLAEGFFGGVLARGDVGVPIFFVLSGLLLYRPWAARAVLGVEPPRVRAYLWKRVLRILPAYWIVVVVALALWSRDRLDDVWTWVQLLLLGQNYVPDPWWGGLGPRGLAQMWSLSVEMAFYLTLPLMAWVLGRCAAGAVSPSGRAKRLLAGLGVFALLGYVWTYFAFHPVYRPEMNVWLPRAWTYFAAGMALAVLLAWVRSERDGHEDGDRHGAGGGDGPAGRFARGLAASWGTCWVIAAMAYAIASTPVTGKRFFGEETLWTAWFELVLYTVVALALVAPVAVADARDSALGRFFGGPVMRFLGEVSYGVFLWQFVVLYAWYELTGQRPWTGNFPLNLLAVAGLTLLLATLTHRLVERPLQRLRGLVR
ncbi:acyltransferase family protein [Bailinhaonella thermotolerans]|uniref:Acyltransferase n=1 Tax=Bailinhaonella thermotolerans TaxID=1070861 RepID=A0A3A4B8E9_9ACTN|nr:acyltransferase [Bailinhaonella thermotolerans]RJL30398.1 acyltransferase [Bailinhaonella thermotolerans]